MPEWPLPHRRCSAVTRRLHQLEQLLPLQTQFVKVPYENTLGGFDLFTPGASALVPQLTGFDGVDYIDTSATSSECDLVVYGKHFNIYESHVNVGGKDLPAEGTGIVTATDANGKAISVVNSVSPLRDASGALQLLKADGTVTPIADNGSFDIISREVMRVRIPAMIAQHLATVTKADGSQWVEISVSTPNGISNRLQVPVKPVPAAKPMPAAQVPGYTLPAGTTVTLAYYVSSPSNGPIVVGPNYKDQNSPQSFTIAPVPLALVDPSPVDVSFNFDPTSSIPLNTITVPPIAFDMTKKAYVVKCSDLGDQLQDAAKILYTSAGSPKPSSIKTTTSTITIKASATDNRPNPTNPVPGLAILDGTTDTQLTINFVYFPGPAPAKGAGPSPVTPGPAKEPARSVPDNRTLEPPAPMPDGVSPSEELNPATFRRTPLSAPARRDARASKTAFQASNARTGRQRPDAPPDSIVRIAKCLLTCNFLRCPGQRDLTEHRQSCERPQPCQCGGPADVFPTDDRPHQRPRRSQGGYTHRGGRSPESANGQRTGTCQQHDEPQGRAPVAVPQAKEGEGDSAEPHPSAAHGAPSREPLSGPGKPARI